MNAPPPCEHQWSTCSFRWNEKHKLYGHTETCYRCNAFRVIVDPDGREATLREAAILRGDKHYLSFTAADGAVVAVPV
jgi:hypothetical protein